MFLFLQKYLIRWISYPWSASNDGLAEAATATNSLTYANGWSPSGGVSNDGVNKYNHHTAHGESILPLGAVAGTNSKPKNNKTMKTQFQLFITLLALQFCGFASARADTLYATANNGLYQFNTAASPASQSTLTNYYGTVTTVVAVDGHGNVFVATDGNFSTDWGDIYEITTNGLMQEVATGLYQPQSLAFDSQGNLFELDGYSDSGQNINEFVNTGGVLSSTPLVFASGADVIGPGYPLNGLAFDSAGDLFVASDYGTYEFASTAETLSSVPTLFSSYGSYGLAFDSSGDLFFSDGGSDLFEFINTGGTLSSYPVYLPTDVDGYSLAIDSHDNLFVSDIATGDGNIYEFTMNGGALSPTPVTIASGLYAGGLAFLPVAPPPKLYVGGEEDIYYPFTGSIYSFAPPAGSASERTVASGLPFEPAGMAVDGQGNLFASDGISNIYEIPKNDVPVVFASGLNVPTGLAFDTNGDLFESDMGSFSLNEFINTAGTLSSTPTPLPIFAYGDILVFDHSGNLFVQDSGSVLEYANIGGTLSIYPEEPPFSVDGIPSGLVFDANGNLFISYPDGDYNEPPYNGVILEFVNNNSASWYNGGVLSSTPITIASGNVAGLTCDPSGNLYEVDGDTGNVYEFANNNGTISSSPTLYAGGLGATCETMNLSVQTSGASKPNLYVGVAMSGTDPAPNAPAVFGFNSTNGAATKTLVAYVGCCNYPLGSLAFDNSGNLFVSDTSTVFELTNNAGTLSSTQHEVDEEGNQLGCGGGVAFDFSGNLFVGDFNYAGVNKFTSASGGVWNNFPLGDPNPFLSGAGYPYSVTFDNNRANLFAAGAFGPEGTALVEFGNLTAPIYQTSHLVFPPSQYGIAPQGLAVDRNGNLFVGESGPPDGEAGTGYIVEYTNTPSGVSTNETLFASGLSNVTGLAFDASGNLFESDGTSGNVYEFINTGWSFIFHAHSLRERFG